MVDCRVRWCEPACEWLIDLSIQSKNADLGSIKLDPPYFIFASKATVPYRRCTVLELRSSFSTHHEGSHGSFVFR